LQQSKTVPSTCVNVVHLYPRLPFRSAAAAFAKVNNYSRQFRDLLDFRFSLTCCQVEESGFASY